MRDFEPASEAKQSKHLAAESEMARTAPGLLLAMPDLMDPNFQKTVVLMIEHTEEGALGLVINRMTQLRVDEVFKSLEIEWEGDDDACVWTGGPVMREIGWILHEPSKSEAEESVAQIIPGVALATTPTRLRELANDPPHQMRFILGAAGWGPGQLEQELTEGAWITADASSDLIFGTPGDQMWERAFKSLGIDPALLVRIDGVH